MGRALGRSGDGLNTLALAAAGLIADRPARLFDIGFQLSFLATAGIARGHEGRRGGSAASPSRGPSARCLGIRLHRHRARRGLAPGARGSRGSAGQPRRRSGLRLHHGDGGARPPARGRALPRRSGRLSRRRLRRGRPVCCTTGRRPPLGRAPGGAAPPGSPAGAPWHRRAPPARPRPRAHASRWRDWPSRSASRSCTWAQPRRGRAGRRSGSSMSARACPSSCAALPAAPCSWTREAAAAERSTPASAWSCPPSPVWGCAASRFWSSRMRTTTMRAARWRSCASSRSASCGWVPAGQESRWPGKWPPSPWSGGRRSSSWSADSPPTAPVALCASAIPGEGRRSGTTIAAWR